MQGQAIEQPPPLGSARVVLWDPNGSNKFVVGGGAELKMYEWSHEKGEVKLAGVRSDLQTMRCFAWSPHSVYNDLLAIGLQSGVVDICRLDQAVPTSATSFQTIQAPVSLSMASVRNRRACTSLAFCQLNPNLLANGLDKSRSEYALLIWDLEASAVTFKASDIDDSFDRLTNPLPNPGKLPKSSLHLHPRSVASSNGTVAGLPGQDLQRGPSRGKMVYQRPMPDPTTTPRGQYCLAEGINSCVFQPNSSWEVVAGVNNKLIRYFDLRVPNKAVKEAPTKAVRGICCDPMDGNLIASLDDIGVHVWDRRKHTYPVLMFQEEDAGVDVDALIQTSIPHPPSVGRITGVEFCNTRRNVLGTTTRDGRYVRLWNLVTGEEHGETQLIHDHESDATDSQAHGNANWAATGSFTDSTMAPSADDRRHNAMEDQAPILAGNRRTKIFKKTVASFDFIPRSAAPTSPPHIVAVSRSGDIELSVVRDSPRHKWSSRGDLIASVGTTYKVYHTHDGFDNDASQEPWDIQFQENGHSPFRNLGTLQQEGERTTENENQNLSVHTSVPRKYSPSSILRMPFDKKAGPGSSISTPRPLAVNLESEEAAIPKAEAPSTYRPALTKQTSHSKGRLSARSEKRTIERNLANDISTTIRRRVLQGYGLESAKHNSEIIKDDVASGDPLSEVWLWLHTSNKVLQAEDALSHIHGFDFTLKGVWAVWEGFRPLTRLTVEPPKLPSQWQPPVQRSGRRASALSATAPRAIQDRRFANYGAAVEWLNRRNTESPTETLTLPKSSSKLPQRRLGLSLVGWNIPDSELEVRIDEWERERSSARAACWATFMGKPQRGIDILGRSHDERHRLLSAVMSAGLHLEKSDSSEAFIQWRDRCQNLAARLDDPYGRILLAWFTSRDWRETMQDVPIPLSERVGIALRFFNDEEVTYFLKENIKTASETGHLGGIILTGINEDAIKILQTYVDRTGDVQTAAIMGALAPRLYVQDKQPRRHRSESITPGPPPPEEPVTMSASSTGIARQIESWFNAYTELLDAWKLFHYRAQFDIDRGQLVMIAMSTRRACVEHDGHTTGEVVSGLVERVEWVPRQLELRCMTCGTSVGVSGPKMLPDVGSGTTAVAACPECKQRLPRCVVCRMYMSFAGEPVDQLLHNPVSDDTLDESLIFCQTCRHGGHANHILGWFFGASAANGEGRKHVTCAVPGCNCHCLDE